MLFVLDTIIFMWQLTWCGLVVFAGESLQWLLWHAINFERHLRYQVNVSCIDKILNVSTLINVQAFKAKILCVWENQNDFSRYCRFDQSWHAFNCMFSDQIRAIKKVKVQACKNTEHTSFYILVRYFDHIAFKEYRFAIEYLPNSQRLRRIMSLCHLFTVIIIIIT